MLRTVLHIAAAVLFVFCYRAEVFAKEQKNKEELSVAVVESTFDPIGKVLSTYHIPYDVIKPADIEKPETYKAYRAIFFPCGIDAPAHERLSVHASGKAISSVSLNEELHELDIERAARHIRAFLREGGSAYFSGYSFKLVQEALNSPFDFFSGHPYIGEEGRVAASLKGDLALFCGEESSALYMTHGGWVAIKDADSGEALSTAVYDTPLGEKSGPISVLFRSGEGEALYTSYHNSVYSDFRRFNIYRIAFHYMIETSAAQSGKRGRQIMARIADAVHDGENVRMYRLPVQSGINRLQIISEVDGLQIDILDSAKHLIESRDYIGKEHMFTIDADYNGYCFVRIYPQKKQRFKSYALTMAYGSWGFPSFLKIILGIAAALIGFGGLIFLLLKLIDSSKYKARPMRKF